MVAISLPDIPIGTIQEMIVIYGLLRLTLKEVLPGLKPIPFQIGIMGM